MRSDRTRLAAASASAGSSSADHTTDHATIWAQSGAAGAACDEGRSPNARGLALWVEWWIGLAVLLAVIAFLRRTLAAPGDTDHVAQRLQSYGALIVMLAPPIGWAVPATLVIMGCGL